MMYLTEVNTIDVIKKQLKFKLYANSGAFTSLMITQFIALLFSLAGVGSMGAGSDWYSISVKQYSADIIIAFTIIWGFITATIITTKAYRYDDFTFVSNRLTSNLSNVLFIILASGIGGVSAMLLGGLLKVIVYFWFGADQLINATSSVSDLIIGLFVSFLYVLLFSAIGYFIGTLCQLHRLVVFFIPILFFGSLFLGGSIIGIDQLAAFFFVERSLLLFTVKAMITVAILFGSSVIMSKRLEVR